MTRKLFFTVITGKYDSLRQPLLVSDGWDYVCFTDQAVSGRQGIWEMVDVREKLSSFSRNPKKRAAMVFIRYFDFIDAGYDIVASADANLKINLGIEEFCRAHFNPALHDIALCHHGERDCAYEEAEVCKRLGYDWARIIDRQMETYRQEGFPERQGLYATQLIIRKSHSEALRNVCKTWADEVLTHSKRIQLSLNYALWRCDNKVRVSEIDWNALFLRRKELEILMHSQNPRGQWTKIMRFWLSLLNRAIPLGEKRRVNAQGSPSRRIPGLGS